MAFGSATKPGEEIELQPAAKTPRSNNNESLPMPSIWQTIPRRVSIRISSSSNDPSNKSHRVSVDEKSLTGLTRFTRFRNKLPQQIAPFFHPINLVNPA